MAFIELKKTHLNDVSQQAVLRSAVDGAPDEAPESQAEES
jgi:hypothetical protein